MSSKILITGGAGFLGYHLTKRLLKNAHQISIIDIDDSNRKDYPPEVDFYKGDVRDLSFLEKITEDVEIIIHAAAALPLWSKKDIFTTNVDGTRNVLETAKKHGIKRVIFISSTAVYGVPKKHPIEENDPLIGVGPYGESKILAEKICLEYRQKGLCVPIIRPKTFIGPERLGVFQILFDWIEDGKKIPIIGNGKNRYQLLDVDDLVDVIILMMEKDKLLVNNTFNVGAKIFGTVKEDVGALCQFAKSGSKVMATPAWLVKFALKLFETLKLSPLYKWVYGTADKDSFVSIEKIEKKLGWQPKYSNAQSLIRTYQWYLDHKEELKNKTGITHRVAWKQGVLKIFKKFL